MSIVVGEFTRGTIEYSRNVDGVGQHSGLVDAVMIAAG